MIYNYFYRIKKIKMGVGENCHLLPQEINFKQHLMEYVFTLDAEARFLTPSKVRLLCDRQEKKGE